jgi:hypothetical protein
MVLDEVSLNKATLTMSHVINLTAFLSFVSYSCINFSFMDVMQFGNVFLSL